MGSSLQRPADWVRLPLQRGRDEAARIYLRRLRILVLAALIGLAGYGILWFAVAPRIWQWLLSLGTLAIVGLALVTRKRLRSRSIATSRIRTSVAIADEASEIRRSLRGALAEQMVRVVGEASNWSDLLHVIEATRPNIALVDVRLPESIGFESARELVRLHPEVALIFVTPYEDRRFIVEALRAGARGYVVIKEPDDLVQIVRLVAGGKLVIAPQLVLALADELSVTPREIEVLQLLAGGRTTKDIAESLYLSPETVKTHLRNIYTKLGASEQTVAMAAVLRSRLVE